MTDPINPDHYKSTTFELIDVIDAFALSFYEAQVVKYVVRARKKNGLEDLKKAKWYLDRLVAHGERQKAHAEQEALAEAAKQQQLTGLGSAMERCATAAEAAFGQIASVTSIPTETWR